MSFIAITAILARHPTHLYVKELDEVQIHPDFLEHKTQVGAWLQPELKQHLIKFIMEQHDCFTWSHTDMTGVHP